MQLVRYYYMAKPVIPRSLRWAMRRMRARKIMRSLTDWPIKKGSEKPPKGWQGWPDGKKFAFVVTHDVESQDGVDRGS